MSRKTVSWAIGVIISGIGIWCLYLTAKSALFALSTGGINGMPVDMRIMAILSSGVTMIFSCLFLFSGVVHIFGYKGTQINYRPTLLHLLILAIFIALSVLALSEYRATSKISWEESRGLPFSFLTLIRGVCNAGIAVWKCRSFESINPLVLITDILIVYFAVCASVQAFFGLSTFSSRRWFLKDSSQIKANGG
jgi:hypothetical protein